MESNKTLIRFFRNALERQHAPAGKFWGVIISTELAKEVADRLEEYDRTGYTPEEFDKLCREMSDLRMALGLDTYDNLRKIIQDDRLLVLPCAIGATVYMHHPLCWENGKATFEGCEYSRDCTHWRGFECPLKVVEGTFNVTMYKRVGKTYWLTREEAEDAIPADRRP